MGISWLSRKEGILEKGGGVDLEKGGMGGRTPLTNDGYLSILLHVLIDFIRKTYNHGM